MQSMNDYKIYSNWRGIKDKIRDELNISVVAFYTWIYPLEVLKVDNNTIYLVMTREYEDDNIARELIEREYFQDIKRLSFP